jgi:hypothetical protein
MPKINLPHLEPEDETSSFDSENYNENHKFVKRLNLQRSILNKLIVSDITMPSDNTNIDPGSPDSN